MKKRRPSPADSGEPADTHSRVAIFERVLTEHSAMISRIVLAYEADAAVRRDLLQEILLAIWSSLPRFRGDASLKTFVASIAHNQSMSHVARAVRRPRFSQLPHDLVSPEPLPEDVAARSRRKAKMLVAVQSLPLEQKQAIVLLLEDLTFEEIGLTLGISARAAAMRCRRARASLATALEDSA